MKLEDESRGGKLGEERMKVKEEEGKGKTGGMNGGGRQGRKKGRKVGRRGRMMERRGKKVEEVTGEKGKDCFYSKGRKQNKNNIKQQKSPQEPLQ